MKRQTTMTRLTYALAVSMALSTANLAHAESVFMGTVDRDRPWTMNVDNSAAAGPTSLTISYLTTATRSRTVLLSVSATGRQAFRDLKMPRGTRRIVLEVSPPRGASIDIEISQPDVSLTHRVEGGATLVFGVVPLFAPPIAVDDTAITDRDVPVPIGVLFNDSNANGAALFVSSTTDPLHGSATINFDGSVIYAPDAGLVGFDSFDYEACADVLCAQATVHVEVR